jgi:hypothetical protein
MVSTRRDTRPTGKHAPASRPCLMGQQLHLMVLPNPEDDRDGLVAVTRQQDVKDQPVLPLDQLGFRNERIGSVVSPHLRTSAEYSMVNVGGSSAEGSSPPMKQMSVGGPIVVRGRESRLQGEGGQGTDAR